jgi:rubrerythrin
LRVPAQQAPSITQSQEGNLMTTPHGLRTPDAVLRTALEKETQSRDFYAKLASECTVDFVKELLQKLQNEESKHMHMIQVTMDKLRTGKRLT